MSVLVKSVILLVVALIIDVPILWKTEGHPDKKIRFLGFLVTAFLNVIIFFVVGSWF